MNRVIAKNVETRAVREAGRAMDGLRKIVRALRVGNVRAESSHGISSAQLFALRSIDSAPGGSLRELANRTLTSQSTVSEVVAHLVAKELITRYPSSTDRRRVELRVSPKGKRILNGAPSTIQEQLAAGFLTLDVARQRSLAEGLEEWIAAAGLADVSAAMFFEDK